jgi:hypothetical protein
MAMNNGGVSPGGAPPGVGGGGGPRVGVSQDSLFFPLPITGGIENILQLSNQEDVKVAYKIRSTIRYRYAVKPTIGFLHPKEESIVKFLLDPNTMTVDGEAPSEQTKDAFLIDFAFAPATNTASSSAAGSSRSSAAEEHNSAVAFWKQYSGGSGAMPPGGVSRRRMPCVFTTKVPKSLTVHVNAAAVASLAATSADNTNNNNHNLKSPSTHFSNGRAASAFEAATPKSSRLVSGQATTPTVTLPPALSTAKAAAVAPHAAASIASAVVTPKPIAASSAAAASSPLVTNPGAVVAASSRTPEEIVGPVRPVREPFLRTFLLYTIPFPVVALLLLLSLFSALVEEEVPTAFYALL